jgi:hypothetical protein
MNSIIQQTNDDSRRIDALVDGELGDGERIELLRRLEQSPDGWRMLAGAFLEAQAWRAALKKPAAETMRQATRAAQSRSRQLGWFATCAIVAGLAFGLGRWSDVSKKRARVDLAANQVQSLPPSDVDLPATVVPAAMRTLTPTIRQELERLGFRVQERPRVVSVQRSDGQIVQVLINEVELRYVGRPFSL